MSIDITRNTYQPGLIGDVVSLHARYYAQHWSFGEPFETKVAAELSGFLQQFDPAIDSLYAAWKGNQLLGSISVVGTGEAPGTARLRWFITSDAVRGTGLGRALMEQAVARMDATGVICAYLTTFAGLDAARHLYETFDFALTEERVADSWGVTVREQRFDRIAGSVPV